MLKIKFLLNPNWPKQLAFFVFMASGTFMVFSNFMVGFRQFTPAEIVFIYVLPWVMLWVFLFYDVVFSKQYRIEIIMMTVIIILGILNVWMSDNRYQSFIFMRMFILSGIIPLWTSMLIITSHNSRKIFYYFSCVWLFIVTCVEILNYYITGSDWIFMHNPIPIGTLVILLMVGPLYILVSGQKRKKLIGAILICMGLMLIVIANKRGTYVAIAGMALAYVFYRYVRAYIYAVIALLLCLMVMAFGWNYYKFLNKDILNHFSILHRLELYRFAWHVYTNKPFWGIGLRAYSHGKYLINYQIHNKSLDKFNETVINLQTFDNMAVTVFVELGSIMALFYFSLILLIIYRYCRNTQPFRLNHEKEFILLMPILGLGIHSMTYDSLIFPQINWLFHVQLGILTAFSKESHLRTSLPDAD